MTDPETTHTPDHEALHLEIPEKRRTLTSTFVRRTVVDHVVRALGWPRQEAEDAFEAWLDERRMVALTTHVHSFEPEAKP
jgi:predicted nucleic acid-binding protein